MPNTAIWAGRILVLIGIVGYAYGMYEGGASLTALIPAAFGIVLMLLGHLSVAKENLRKHLMHGAVVFALLGFILPAWRLISKIRSISQSAAVISEAAMALVCLIFVVLAVRSFIAAGRERNGASSVS